MHTLQKLELSNKPGFFDKHSFDILAVSFGAFAIVVFLSVAFIRYDATSLPPSHSTIGENNQSIIDTDEGVRDLRRQKRSEPTEDLIAATNSPQAKTPFQLVSGKFASSSYVTIHLNAAIPLDSTMWRYTSEGWHDISMAADPPQTDEPLIEGVHPVIWTAMLLLSSLLLLIMASSNEEIKKLFHRSSI